MRAILVKPEAKGADHVEVVEYNGDWKTIYDFLSYEGHEVRTFACVEIDATHTLYVDDEGLLNNPEHFMVWDGYCQPLAGRGLILGADEYGESVACELNEEWVREQVTCMDLARVLEVFG